MNEQVRQAMERLWHAQRVLLAAQDAEGGAFATVQAAQAGLREREAASRLANEEVCRAMERLFDLARQAAGEEAA